MLRAFLSKLKESLISVAPVTVIVLALGLFGLIETDSYETVVFILSAMALIVGMALFNLGADMAMSPMGNYMGTGLIKSQKLSLLLIAAFLIGLLVTIAEPDLNVLAAQVAALIDDTTLIVTVGIGVGIFLLAAVLKIVFHKDLSILLMLFYLILFAVCALMMEQGKGSFAPLAFDSGGVTTGPITVPFIMAFGVGIAATIGGKNAGENSFGLIALCSIGPMLAVMLLVLGASGELSYSLPDYSMNSILSGGVFGVVLSMAMEVVISLVLIVLFFVIINVLILKLPKRRLVQIFKGIAFTFIGLVIFLSAANIGFMPIGYKIGYQLAEQDSKLIIGFGFIIGMVVVLAEPAVHVLNEQVEEITGGFVTKRSMLIALCLGVGVSIGLSMARVVFGFSILYYLIPGYLLSMALSVFVPKIYTGIAFDSGGVASGPMTSTFILPMAIGACVVMAGENSVLDYAFGIVAMVAMTPLITIQTLGFKAIAVRIIRERRVIRHIRNKDDEQIIYFDMR